MTALGVRTSNLVVNVVKYVVIAEVIVLKTLCVVVGVGVSVDITSALPPQAAVIADAAMIAPVPTVAANRRAEKLNLMKRIVDGAGGEGEGSKVPCCRNPCDQRTFGPASV